MSSSDGTVVVIGAGVIGLSCALEIQSSSLDVLIIARDLPAPFATVDPVSQIDYASAWAGAHNRIVPPNANNQHPGLAREHAFSLATFKRMEQLHRENPDTAGITFIDGIEYLERPGPEYLAISETGEELGLKDFKILRGEELPSRVRWGCRYRTWCVNPMVYCCFLLNRFIYHGGKVVRRNLTAVEEAFSLDIPELGSKKKVAAVVNASGMGFGDADVFPVRGQTCLIANACPETVTRQNADGSWTFSVPRNFGGGTVVGGTKDVEDWNPVPDPKVRAKLLARFAETYPAILLSSGDGVRQREKEEKNKKYRQEGERGFRVLADIVGRRHTRKGGMRLEVDAEVLERQNEVLVHAYGLGGRGFELSWGVAEEVRRLALQCLHRGGGSFSRSHL